ncbi:MAG: DegQ family serine endoprotease [Pseudomonadota bacterium]
MRSLALTRPRVPVMEHLTALLVLAFVFLAAQVASAQARPDSFADLAERLSPSVVNISTSQTVERPQGGPNVPQVPEGSPFEDLFRDFFDQNGRPQGPREVQSLGSGFVVSAEGFVVTNNHVIADADEIQVNFPDGTSLVATLVGTDPKTDIALLKVEPTSPLPFVQFGDSDISRVGDWVLAIGNPFGLGGSVSAGIISARNRDIQAGPYDDFIQTDAAINRGNSGGPLFNMDGEVIGVNTAIISPSGGSIGIGFSVPANLAKNVVAQLQEFGETRRGWLGVRIQEVTDELGEALGLDKASGALVADVSPGGPAEAAGIEAGDVILKFDGRNVDQMRDLPRMVAETPVGKAVRVVIFRKGKTQTVKVDLGRLEGSVADGGSVAPSQDGSGSGEADTALSSLGLSLRPLSDSARREFSIGDDVSGVLISSVEPGGSAAEEGVAPGDVIVEVGQEPVSSPAEVSARVEDAKNAEPPRKSVLFLIQSGPDLRFVPLKISG